MSRPGPDRIPTAPLEAAWRQRLGRQAAQASARQPALATLGRRLLALGGDAACFAEVEPDLAALLARGQVFAGAARLQPGWPGACHENAARRWHAQPTTLQIVTGYALSNDSCWRQHSWLLETRGRQVIETTVRRRLYFGWILTAAEAAQFWADCGRPGAAAERAAGNAPAGADAADAAADLALGQDLVGVRLIVGAGNFARVAHEQHLPAALVARAGQAAADLETEIATRYPDRRDALTVGLVNARLLLGAARFAAMAGQVGLPPTGIAEIDRIAQQHEIPDPLVAEAAPVSALTRAQRQGLRAAHLAGRITAHEYGVVSGQAPAAAGRDLAALVGAGWLVVDGRGRGAVYRPARPVPPPSE